MRKIIYVLLHGAKWKVKCDHCDPALSIKDTQAEAISRAKQHVRSLPEGTLSQILVQGRDAKWRAEWTYGKDPFPPIG